MVSGGAHNVAFDPAQISAAAKAQLSANMQQQVSELSSPMMMNPNETYTISFGKIPPGKYPYHCTPHLALGMKGTITVEELRVPSAIRSGRVVIGSSRS